MSGDGVLFLEVQRLRTPGRRALGWGLGFAAAGAAVGVGRSLPVWAAVGVAAVALTLGAACGAGEPGVEIRTSVSLDGIRIRTGDEDRFIAFEDVEACTARDYEPGKFGGHGVRKTDWGVTYTSGGDRGVEVLCKSGERFFVGSRFAGVLSGLVARRAAGLAGEAEKRERSRPHGGVVEGAS